MTATVRHMPLVTQLHRNTSVITKEIKHFRTVVSTFVEQIREHVDSVLSTLLKGTRRVPEFEVSIMDDVKMPVRRPRTSRLARPKTRQELHAQVDQFSGVEQEDNSRVLDSLLLESPLHSHESIAPPKKMVRMAMSRKLTRSLTTRLANIAEGHADDELAHRQIQINLGVSMVESDDELGGDGSQARAPDKTGTAPNKLEAKTSLNMVHLQRLQSSTYTNNQAGSDLFARSSSIVGGPGLFGQVSDASRSMQSRTMANIFKRNNQRTDSLIKTLFDSTVPPVAIRECFRLLRKSDKKKFQWMTEAIEGFLDSDVEESLHNEIDSMTNCAEENLRHEKEDWWEKEAARLFNSLALKIVQVEAAYMILHGVLCVSLPAGRRPDADPMLSMDNVARALVALATNTRNLDLDKAVEEVHSNIKAFRLLQTPKARRANTDMISGYVRFSTLVSASSLFRGAILSMDVDRTLCLFCKSILSEMFNEEQARLLLEHAKMEVKVEDEVLFNNKHYDERYLTLVIKGEIEVIRTLDDVEIGRGKCTVGCYFGADKAINKPDGIPEAEQENPVKEGGTGVNNCIIKAAAKCQVLRIPLVNFKEVLPRLEEHKFTRFMEKLVEAIASDISKLEQLNFLVLPSADSAFVMIHKEENWKIPPTKREYYTMVPELERQEIQDAFLDIQTLWHHLSRGADTVPKGTIELIKEHLGESGAQCYANVFAPVDEPTAPSFLSVETFWFCWVHFLTRSLIHSTGKQDHEDEIEQETKEEEERALSSASHKGVVTLLMKNATKLQPMDTFTGRADPYMVVSVDGVTQRTQVKSGTLEPVWNEAMTFNAVANRSIVRVELFDSEAMGQDRSMGTFMFIVTPHSTSIAATHKLTGQVSDRRPATGTVSLTMVFNRGAKAAKTVEQKNEFQLFCETEHYTDLVLSMLFPSRRIEAAFFRVPLPVHEREFQKAVGTLAVPLTGLR